MLFLNRAGFVQWPNFTACIGSGRPFLLCHMQGRQQPVNPHLMIRKRCDKAPSTPIGTAGQVPKLPLLSLIGSCWRLAQLESSWNRRISNTTGLFPCVTRSISHGGISREQSRLETEESTMRNPASNLRVISGLWRSSPLHIWLVTSASIPSTVEEP